MEAELILSFEDGTQTRIRLAKAIEINTSGRKSLEFRETDKGWVMAFTKSLFEGKRIQSIQMEKQQ